MGFLKWVATSIVAWSVLAGLVTLLAIFDETGPFAIAAMLPITMFVLALTILTPAKMLVQSRLPDSKFKRFLLYSRT